jgi:hypothetical protein
MDYFDITIEEHNGHTIGVTWHYDEDCEAPWEHEGGHGPVSDWTRRDKAPGEMVLCEDRGSKRYYDFAEAIKIAKRDGWDAPPYKTGTKGQQAKRAVEADFKYLQRWCKDDWFWCGYVVTVDGTQIDSLWGIDSDSRDEFTKEAIEQAKAHLDREEKESADAACRDIATVTP